MTFREAVEMYVGALLRGPLLVGDATRANISSLVEAWIILKYTQDQIDKRVKELRTVLLARANEFGRTTDNGGQKLRVEGSTVVREQRKASLPDEEKLRALLEDHDLAPDQAFTQVTKVVMDASKVQNLVDLGKLPKVDVESAKKIVWALRVKEDPDLLDALEEIVGGPVTENAPRKARNVSKRSKAAGSRKGG